ncbi:hypothetical protein BD626DRAFT_198467 [Schizophyllum amplum]|uniref:Zn(2)-C6 fungal-type domain-containing protein n=1 Tax=Schizophyllum amplum TaxID=97359 RepID=A0A550CN17_9AGAR|nr:hypothetical protein BD626DRAFT_198467 [Auriculariopsis ampla]
MPKVPTPHGTMYKASTPTSTAANMLKRNQACHQCRRRKLKCDAKRPACSTCIRSHAHAVSHAPPDADLPSEPVCTFDEVQETPTTGEGHKSRYERLENRINELETLLRQKEASESAPGSTSAPIYPSPSSSATSAYAGNAHAGPSSHTGPQLSLEMSGFATHNEVLWSNWPEGLPRPDLLRHLVEMFFMFHPHAQRLFHFSTFMTCLSLGATHPKFPAPCLLHAICAIASFYTAAVSSPPLPDLSRMAPDEIFDERLRERGPDSFAEEQARLAMASIERTRDRGEYLFQGLQASLIMCWYFWAHSQWVQVYVQCGHTMRLTVPLGMNMCPPFRSISTAVRPPSLLPPARNIVEDETRRNTFWLIYCAERLHGLGNGWAMGMDDDDISQMMPVCRDQFEQGILVSAADRQWAHTHDVLLQNPVEHTDSFVLYVKGAILLSRVKRFNLRFRSQHFIGNPAMSAAAMDTSTPGASTPYMQSTQDENFVDPRTSPAFIELERIANSFRQAFPPHLRYPIQDNVVDNHLYAAHLMPYVSLIVLHDPHADVRVSGCISALKILTAARALLDLIYSVLSTSFDITLLDTFAAFGWLTSGRVLVRFLQAAVHAHSEEQIQTLRQELDFVYSALMRMGDRIPLAFRFGKMLGELIIARCGPALAPKSNALDFPRRDSAMFLNTLFDATHQSMPTTGFAGMGMYNYNDSVDDPLSFLGFNEF